MKNSTWLDKSRPSLLLCVALFSGCVGVKPDDLQAPPKISCVNFKEPLSFTDYRGLLNVKWTTRLERGPYWSEKVDDKGTYYRAPPGGVSVTAEGMKIGNVTDDGGYFMPNDPNEAPRLYKYFSTAAAPVQVPPESADCSTVGFAKDPATTKVSLVSFAASGAVGGAAGGLIGRSVARGGMSYGQAAGAGAAGGLIGGLIVASIVNADVGRIVVMQPLQNAQFVGKLRELTAAQVPVEEVQIAPAADDATAVTTPAAAVPATTPPVGAE